MPFAEETFDWEDLVDAISESSVVPVVGNELWILDRAGEQQSIEQYYLERLTEKLLARIGSDQRFPAGAITRYEAGANISNDS